LDRIFTLVAQGFSVAFTAALVVVPLCIALALRLGGGGQAGRPQAARQG
jgi:hypothetical protein